MNTRTTPARALPALGTLALLLVALAGCLKIDGDLSIAGNTVSGTILTAVDKAAAEQLEIDPADVFAAENDELSRVEGVSSEPFDDGTWAGSELTFDQVNIDDLNQLSDGDPDGLRIVQDPAAGTYEFSMVLDFTFISQLEDEQPDTEQPVDVPALLENFEATVAVTFPGEVTEHNGELSGTTVNWTAPPRERTELRAVALGAEGGGTPDPGSTDTPETPGSAGDPATPGDPELASDTRDGSDLTAWLFTGLGLAVLAAAAAVAGWWFYLRPRWNRQPADPADPAGNPAPEPDVE